MAQRLVRSRGGQDPPAAPRSASRHSGDASGASDSIPACAAEYLEGGGRLDPHSRFEATHVLSALFSVVSLGRLAARAKKLFRTARLLRRSTLGLQGGTAHADEVARALAASPKGQRAGGGAAVRGGVAGKGTAGRGHGGREALSARSQGGRQGVAAARGAREDCARRTGGAADAPRGQRRAPLGAAGQGARGAGDCRRAVEY